MKKKCSLLLICVGLTISLLAQTNPQYSIYGGLLGGANYSRFKITDRGSLNLEGDWKWGYVAGAYLNFPLGKVVSIEPQVLYSVVGGKVRTDGTQSLNQKLDYLSVPLLFKFHLGRWLALTAGPQFDFRTGAKTIDPEVENKDLFKSTSIGLGGGFELFPRERVTVYGRYVHGMTKVYENNETEPYYYNQLFQAGLKFKLFGKKKEAAAAPPPPPMPPADSDGDGIIDSLDKCPNQAGLAKYQGCPVPDSDGDGINDEEDKCPNEAGTAKYQGCPIPDSDKDGINDDEDKCPTVAGVKEYQGCPIPDTDKDGINDPEDKCPTIAGVKENDGCPAIPKFSAANIQFVTGSAKLTSNAVKELNDIVDYMKQYPEIKLEINGHTDNVGKAAFNQTLSEKRAASVVSALTKKGIDASRLTSNGYGLDQPIADNSTAAGRTKNRRVEFKFHQ